MLERNFFQGTPDHPGFGAHWYLFDEEPSDSSPGFARLYGRSDTGRFYEKREGTVRSFAFEQQANIFTLTNRFKDLEIDDQDATPIGGRRLRNIDGRILATDPSQVEGRHISRLSIELLEDSDLVESYILADGSRPFSGDTSLGGNLLNDVADPVDPQDAATKAYVDALAGWTTVKKTADESVNADDTLQDDDDLEIALEASSTYAIRLVAFFETLAAADFKYRILGPAAPIRVRRTLKNRSGGAGAIQSLGVKTDFDAADVQLLGTGADGVVEEEMIVETDVTPGTLKLQWAQNTATTGDTTVFKGSYLSYIKIA